MTDDQRKHLEFIQNIITRMNTNSFQIKEWTVILVSALLALYASTKNPFFILAGVFPAIIFWFLDTYYLTQERKFRGLYNDVAGVTDNSKDIKLYEMRPDLYIGGKYSYCNVFFSVTILILYLSIIIILIGLFVFFQSCLLKGG